MSRPQRAENDGAAITTVLSALSDPLRLGIVRLLADDHERQWGELDAPVSNSTLSHHLKVLRSAGITQTRKEGTRCFVWLRRADLQERYPGLLDSVLAGAEGNVTEVGTRARASSSGARSLDS